MKSIKKEDLLSLDLFKDKKADNVIKSIAKSKDVELARFAEKTSAKNGLYIEDVQKDSCLYKAGIENGDVILAINDKPMNSMIELRKLLYSLNDGDVITLKVLRNEEVHILRADICC